MEDRRWKMADGRRAACHLLSSISHLRIPPTLGGETGSRLAYTQQSEGQHLPERPSFAKATAWQAISAVELMLDVSEARVIK
jgi:hypothetical protein